MTPTEWNVMDLLFPVVVPPLEQLRQEAAEIMCGGTENCGVCGQPDNCGDCNHFRAEQSCPCKRVTCSYPECEADGTLD